MKKIMLVIAGVVSLSLGVVGIVLPVLPTTPFLLLAAACFLRSSDRLYNWLIHHKVFGRYIQSYMEYKAISIRAKIVSLLSLWLVIGTTVIFFIDPLWLRILLGCVALGVTIYLLRLKTLTPDMIDELNL